MARAGQPLDNALDAPCFEFLAEAVDALRGRGLDQRVGLIERWRLHRIGDDVLVHHQRRHDRQRQLHGAANLHAHGHEIRSWRRHGIERWW